MLALLSSSGLPAGRRADCRNHRALGPPFKRPGGGTHRFGGSPFETLRELLRERARSAATGAAVGYLAYELKRFVEDVPAAAVDDLGLPERPLCFYDRVARFDPRPLAARPPP